MFEGLFQPMHLLVILVIAMFVFGPKRISELGKGLGDGIRSFKGAIREQPEKNQKQDSVTSTSIASETTTPEVS